MESKRLLILIILLFGNFIVSAQHNKYSSLFLLNRDDVKSSYGMEEHLVEYDIIDLNTSIAKSILDDKPVKFTLTIPGHDFVLELHKQDVIDKEFKIKITGESGQESVVLAPNCCFYSGKIKGSNQSIVCLSVFNNQVNLFFSNENDNYTLGQIKSKDFATYNKYVFYADKAIINPESQPPCGTIDLPALGNSPEINEISTQKSNAFVNECPWVIFFDVDYNLFLNQGSNIDNCFNITFSNFFIVKTLYANENINLSAYYDMHIWTIEDPFANNNKDLALEQFREYWKGRSYNGHFAHLLQPENIGGIAYYSSGCDNDSHYAVNGLFNYANPYPSYSANAKTVAHELGHNFGSPHTHWCGWPGGAIDNCFAPEGDCSLGPNPQNGGTIMSYCHLTNSGVNFSNGFGPLPGNKIREGASNKNCNCATLDNVALSNEGFICIEKEAVPQVSVFQKCEPIWYYPQFKCLAGNYNMEVEQIWNFSDGTNYTYEWNRLDATYSSFSRYYYDYNDDWHQWPLGNHNVQTFIKYKGEYQLMDIKYFSIIDPPSNLLCGTKLYLNGNNNLADASGNNTPVTASGNISYVDDRYGNCKSAFALSNGSYLTMPVINERAVSFWFKANSPDQMIIYDGGPKEKESYDWIVGMYKPNGLGANSTFDNTYGMYFATWGHDFAIPYDVVKFGWHQICVSRDVWDDASILINIDGKTLPTWYLSPLNGWTLKTYPFLLDLDGVHCTFQTADLTYGSYIGKDFQDHKMWDQGLPYFNGALDEFKIYTQLLTAGEMTDIYNEDLSNPSNVSASIGNTSPICHGQQIQLNSIADGAVGYSWSGPNGYSSNMQNPIINNANSQMNGIYTVNVNLGQGCSANSSVEVSVQAEINVNISGQLIFCNGESTTLTASGGNNYLWNTGINENVIMPGQSGTYSVTITDGVGCTNSNSVNIVEESAIIVVFNSSTGSIPNTCDVTTTVTGATPPYTYLWSTGATTPEVKNLPSGNHTVTVTAQYACDSVFTCSCSPTMSNYNLVSSGITIYPNPSTGIFNISIVKPTSSIYTINVHDVLGNQILTKEYNQESEFQIDLSTYSCGMYVISIESGHEAIRRWKVVKVD